jgi:hypothetical protein
VLAVVALNSLAVGGAVQRLFCMLTIACWLPKTRERLLETGVFAIDMAQPLLNLKDSDEQAIKKKKKPFSRPRKDKDGAAIPRVVSKKPKEQTRPVVVQPDVPEKKSQKRKCVAALDKCLAHPLCLISACRKKEKYREKLKAKRLTGSKKKPEDKNKRNLKWCFGCRARGHTLENCPKVQAHVGPRAQSADQQEGSNVLLCFNCGSKGAVFLHARPSPPPLKRALLQATQCGCAQSRALETVSSLPCVLFVSSKAI